MWKWTWMCVGLIGASLGIAPKSNAMVLPYQTLSQQIQTAHHIVRGTLVGKKVVWDTRRGSLLTHYKLRVQETLKGRHQPTLWFSQIGGQKDGRITQVPGAAEFKQGEHIVVFLHPPTLSGQRYLMGFAAGKYRVLQQGHQLYLHRELHHIAFAHPAKQAQKVAPLAYSERPIALTSFRQTIQRLKPTFQRTAHPQARLRILWKQRFTRLHHLKRTLQQQRVQQLKPLRLRPKRPVSLFLLRPRTLPRTHGKPQPRTIRPGGSQR